MLEVKKVFDRVDYEILLHLGFLKIFFKKVFFSKHFCPKIVFDSSWDNSISICLVFKTMTKKNFLTGNFFDFLGFKMG